MVDGAIETRFNGEEDDRSPYDISKIDFERLRQEFERSPVKRTNIQNLKQAIEVKLRRLLEQNPLRTDFQRHHEKVVAEYNREKDRLTIEQTFEALIKLVQELDKEETRAMREGLDEESLALFDLLKKPDLTPLVVKKIKKVAVELLATLKAEKLKIYQWRDREATRDAVRVAIHNFLYNEGTGLPADSYTNEEVTMKSEEVFVHVYRAIQPYHHCITPQHDHLKFPVYQ